MPLYMYEAAYTAESLAAQLKKPQNRADAAGRAACEAVGGKLVGSIASVTTISSTTVLMTGAEAVAGMKRAEAVAKTYKPAQ